MRIRAEHTKAGLRRGAIAGLTLLAACVNPPPVRVPSATAVTADTSVSRGHELALQHCSSCHVVHLSQAIDDRSPMRAVSFYVIAGNADWSSDTLRMQLDRLHPRMGIMALSDEERAALAIYILTLRNDMGIGG